MEKINFTTNYKIQMKTTIIVLYYTYLQKKRKMKKPNADDPLGIHLCSASCTVKIGSTFLASNLATYNKSLKTN